MIAKWMHQLEQMACVLDEQIQDVVEFNDELERQQRTGVPPLELQARAAEFYILHPVSVSLSDVQAIVSAVSDGGQLTELAVDVANTCRKVLALLDEMLRTSLITAVQRR